jgi:hypothetical protein
MILTEGGMPQFYAANLGLGSGGYTIGQSFLIRFSSFVLNNVVYAGRVHLIVIAVAGVDLR